MNSAAVESCEGVKTTTRLEKIAKQHEGGKVMIEPQDEVDEEDKEACKIDKESSKSADRSAPANAANLVGGNPSSQVYSIDKGESDGAVGGIVVGDRNQGGVEGRSGDDGGKAAAADSAGGPQAGGGRRASRGGRGGGGKGGRRGGKSTAL